MPTLSNVRHLNLGVLFKSKESQFSSIVSEGDNGTLRWVGGRKIWGMRHFNLLCLPQRDWTPGLKKVWGQSLLRFVPQHPLVKEQSSLCLGFCWSWSCLPIYCHETLPWMFSLEQLLCSHLLVDPSSASSFIAGGSVKVSHCDVLIVGSASRRCSKR